MLFPFHHGNKQDACMHALHVKLCFSLQACDLCISYDMRFSKDKAPTQPCSRSSAADKAHKEMRFAVFMPLIPLTPSAHPPNSTLPLIPPPSFQPWWDWEPFWLGQHISQLVNGGISSCLPNLLTAGCAKRSSPWQPALSSMLLLFPWTYCPATGADCVAEARVGTSHLLNGCEMPCKR